MMIKYPNILITGTPGVGKSTMAAQVAENCNLQHISVSDLAKENNLFDGYDDALQCHILDEDKVLDELEDPISEGGKVVDYHGSSFFPERFFDAVFVLRCNNTVLHDRLAARGYTPEKILENIECEILHVLRDEALENYKPEIVMEVENDTVDQLEAGVNLITEWVKAWVRQHDESMEQ
ncbi:adenylate kinase isoenzyme 6 [Hyalella azteca]|uniref:Adenylate kinase isoenzyme 6 homolog n=1 Tax=Hyalella azteca TaxID=294128 RepID=A0A8B7PQE3_HYAAZ|nr:adenylate kinase isoenzyme 6 [Hyalella azteca]XP_018027691.1 adenylate kinase isoenzyme 6 [Hyalella azteca]